MAKWYTFYRKLSEELANSATLRYQFGPPIRPHSPKLEYRLHQLHCELRPNRFSYRHG